MFIVELRDNRIGTTEADLPVAWLGLREEDDGHPEGPREVVTVVSKRGAATEYHNATHAKNDLNRLKDEFFDRYWPTVVEVTSDVEA